MAPGDSTPPDPAPSADVGDGGDSTSVEDGWPADWTRPTRFPSIEPGTVAASPRLPPPTLTDPAEIGLALYDPATVPVAVVSLAQGLGYGIDGDDGRVILAPPPGTKGRLLPEGVVRSIIEQGVADAKALRTSDTGSFSWTFTDLGDALLPFLPAWDVGRLAAAYDEAYREAPESVAAGVMLGEPIEPVDAALSRPHLDAACRWVRRPGSASVAPPGVALAAAPPSARVPRTRLSRPPDGRGGDGVHGP